MLCRRMREEPGQAHRLPDLANDLGVGVDQCIRLFRHVVGSTPAEYRIACRIEAAKDRLRSSSQPLTEIARDLGYCDVFAFSKQFKARVGISPLRFRQRG